MSVWSHPSVPNESQTTYSYKMRYFIKTKKEKKRKIKRERESGKGGKERRGRKDGWMKECKEENLAKLRKDILPQSPVAHIS